jgi:hypothetical protein
LRALRKFRARRPSARARPHWFGGSEIRTPDAISVHCFPSTDRTFHDVTARIAAESRERIQATERLIAEVQERLRDQYPLAVVRLRDEQAELGTPAMATLYAFRDGRAA